MTKLIKNFYLLIRDQKFFFYILIALLIFYSFIELFSLALLVPLILFFQDSNNINNILSNYIQLGFNFNEISNQELFLYFLLSIILIFTFKFFLLSYIQLFKFNFLKKIYLSKSSQLFENILRKDPIFFSKNSIAYLMQVSEENRIFFSNTLNNILLIFQDAAIGLLIFIVLLKVETTGTLVVLIFISICSYLIYFFTKKKLTILGEKKFNYSKDVINTLKEGFEAIREIKIFRAEKFFSKRLQKSNFQFLEATYSSEFIKFFPKPLFEILVTIFLIIIFKHVSSITNNFDIFLIKLSIYALACIRVVPIAYRLVLNFQTLKFSFFSFERIVENLIKEKGISNQNNDFMNFKSKISFDNVFFKYNENDEKFLLNKLNFEINKGDFTGIVGPSGSGKSTIIDLIIGFLNPSKGEIKIDGSSLKFKSNKWFENISYVPQRISLNNTSLKKNIAFGIDEKEISDKKVIESIKQANLENYLNEQKEGINTNISDFGINLSGGQAQRIGIARAIYKNSEIIIFDESTSSLDERNEKDILNTISKFKGNKTIIFVTHKKSLLSYFDRIFLIENGELIEKKN